MFSASSLHSVPAEPDVRKPNVLVVLKLPVAHCPLLLSGKIVCPSSLAWFRIVLTDVLPCLNQPKVSASPSVW